MKLAWLAAALLTAAACEPASKLDKMPGAGQPLPSGDLEARIAILEQKLAAVTASEIQWLRDAYVAQAAREAQRAEQQAEPVAGVVYGVDIAQNLELGHYEGERDAYVTIIEAFDFA